MSHSVILGGSNAQRLLSCPASYQEALKSSVADVESLAAKEGTMLHEVMADLINRKVSAKALRASGYMGKLPVNLTEEQEEALATALDALEELKAKYPGDKPWRVLALEEQLTLNGVTGAFGTVDLIIANDVAVICVDWKFGRGVIVKALYQQADGSEQLNAQGAFYACCGRAKYKRQFKDKTIVIAIVQPRSEVPYSYTETTAEELDGFYSAFDNAVLEAMGRDPYRERGDHCFFATCKATCVLWTGPVLDLAVIEPNRAALQASADNEPTKYGAFLSRALTLAEMAETWAVEIRRQAHVFMEDGGTIREWKLVPKRGTRQWVNPQVALDTLCNTDGIGEEDVMTAPELKSVAQVEKALKPKKIAVPAELFEMVSTGTTIAHSDDARPESTHAQVITDLRAALKAL